MKKTLLLVIGLFIFIGMVTTGQADEPKWCPLCSMNLKMYHPTSNRLTLSDGSKVQTCSIFCAAQIYEKKAAEIEKWEVVDYATKVFINARKAVWVMGSDLPGVMTAVSKLAFVAPEEAQQFQKAHGGAIGTFDEALNRTMTDMGLDRKMIMARVAERAKMGRGLAEKNDCFRCHGPERKEGSASAFTTPEFAQKMDTRIKIKEAILRGGPGMAGYAGKLNEKDLHTIMLYLWSLRPTG
jgi:nitrous oxide reductase accessory protein NosL